MKILLFANTDWYLYNFRRSLAERLRAKGWQVVLVSPPGPYGHKLEELGFHWISVPFSTRSTNPLHELALIRQLIKLYRRERPALVHHFTIKCVLYGTIAAKLVGGIRIVNAVTGLGHVFTDPGMKARLVRPIVRGLYRLALSGRQVRVIYQNAEDQDSFVKWGLVDRERTQLIRGSGVNVTKFSVGIRSQQGEEKVQIKLLFASRLLREKGLFELIDAFGMVRTKHPGVELLIAGAPYPENPSSLTSDEVETLGAVAGVTLLGHVDDMMPLLADSDIVVLPSYREGTPRILIEAAAMGKPIVATAIAGCRGLVIDGENGFLVQVKSVEPLAAAIEKLVESPVLREQFGAKGRDIVLGEFDEEIVIEKTLNVYQGLI